MRLQEKYENIYKIHVSRLNISSSASASPSFVVFSAIPGSGKSEISKRLEHDYGYLRITNKLIRESIAESGYEDIVIGRYTLWFLSQLTKSYRPNIVFDRNIDQWYEPSKKWAYENNYRYVLILIDVSMDILKKRLLSREGTTESRAHQMLDFYNEQHKESLKLVDVTVSLSDNYDIDIEAKAISKL